MQRHSCADLLAGLLTVSQFSFLVSITRRQQVAQIQGKPIYVVTEVALTPLGSKVEAETSIANTQAALQKTLIDGDHGMDDSDTEDDEGELPEAISDDVDDDIPPPSPGSSFSGERKTISSVAEDVMTRKGGYGRFANKWFSRRGWTIDQKRNLGMTGSQSSVDTVGTEPSQTQSPSKAAPGPKSDAESAASIQEQKANDIASNLLPKLLRTTQILFGSSRSFYFSYDYDITRRLAKKRPSSSELPLYTQVDPLYFWNRHVIEPFVDAGQKSLILPLMQGFVGQRSFEMDSNPPKPVIGMEGTEKSSMELSDLLPRSPDEPASARSSGCSNTQKQFLLTLISRRSVRRGGLRYLRRGIDEDGNTANSVETEQILSDVSWNPASKIHSFVQIRGSIPVFFSQSPYSFKPIPQLQHSEEMNYRAFTRHFHRLSEIYGSVQIATLVEKHGPEAIVGDEYKKNLDRLNEAGGINGGAVGFEWFDFHAMCRGMKFENVSYLIDTLAKTLDRFGDTVELDGKQLNCQRGILRTNCMDCLDRTNVTQSACGRRALELQLKNEGIDMSLQVDQTTTWFNTLWADNGDAISKQVCSVSLLI